jgi:microsomal dipeptidase-like Zn-dependent dipeptidase
MLVDLHAHYPMHVVPDGEGTAHQALLRWRGVWWRARLVDLLSRLFNYQGPGDKPGVTVELMRQGDVGVILSVLYDPLDEMDLSKRYGSPPDRAYLPALIEQLESVEADVAHQAGAVVAHTRAELELALQSGQRALIHAVEGGFHLGGTPDEVRRAVRELAARGVAYITLAHLFWRGVATGAPALPFLPDPLYRLIFPQPRQGLSELGLAAAEAMLEHRVLIDLTHMSTLARAQTLDLMEERDPGRRIPVIATHEACRLGPPLRGREYNLTDDEIGRIAARGGVIGLILCPHYILGGWLFHHRQTRDLDASVDAVCRHVDHIRDLTGSLDHVAIGSDLDGWIKPALKGLGHLGQMARFQERLRSRYGDSDAEKISSGNALRVLRAAWG